MDLHLYDIERHDTTRHNTTCHDNKATMYDKPSCLNGGKFEKWVC
jgi:hypothetical protein